MISSNTRINWLMNKRIRIQVLHNLLVQKVYRKRKQIDLQKKYLQYHNSNNKLMLKDKQYQDNNYLLL